MTEFEEMYENARKERLAIDSAINNLRKSGKQLGVAVGIPPSIQERRNNARVQ